MDSLPLTKGRKLRLFQTHDPYKQWWSLDEMRFCARCGHLFLGRDIQVSQDQEMRFYFQCPTFQCAGDWKDWQYPELHL
jgi:hypothetical protein